MAPSSYYSQIDVSGYTEEQVVSLIEKSGKRFYWLKR